MPFVPLLQYWLWHWASSPHAAPFVSVPAAGRHAAGRLFDSRSEHIASVTACAQPSIPAGVQLEPIEASEPLHPDANADSHVGTSPYAYCTKKSEHWSSFVHTAFAASVHACMAVTVGPPPLLEHATTAKTAPAAPTPNNARDEAPTTSLLPPSYKSTSS
jgi:hypothetical protein